MKSLHSENSITEPSEMENDARKTRHFKPKRRQPRRCCGEIHGQTIASGGFRYASVASAAGRERRHQEEQHCCLAQRWAG